VIYLDVGVILSLTLLGCIVVFGTLFILLYLFIIREKKPPKYLKNIDWKIWSISNTYFKRLGSNKAKIAIIFQYKDHGITYEKHKKCIIEYIETIPVTEHNLVYTTKNNYECWKIIDDDLAKDKIIFYNKFYWVYDNEELENRYRGKINAKKD